MNTSIQALHLPENYRLLVVSDIHGNYSLFERLLQECGFGPEDHLLLLGDLIDKGSQSSSECLRRIFRLADENDRVHIVQGNCDDIDWALKQDDDTFFYFLTQRRMGLLGCWAKEDGLVCTQDRASKIKHAIRERHSDEIRRLASLPRGLENDDFLFVHAGIETPDYRSTAPSRLVKNDFFYFSTPGIHKWVVFGHMPCNNLRPDQFSCSVLFDHRRKLIGIDGGNAVLRFGQLNALIIEKKNGSLSFDSRFADTRPTARAAKSCRGYRSDKLYRTDYLNMEIERILSVNAHFTLCRLKEGRQHSYIKNEWIERRNGRLFVRHTSSQEQLSLAKGERVYLLDNTLTGFDLAKKLDGRVGWVKKGILVPEHPL